MNRFIYWKNNQVVETDALFAECICIDRSFPDERNRYGKYPYDGPWIPISFNELPSEFKTALLLLGVS